MPHSQSNMTIHWIRLMPLLLILILLNSCSTSKEKIFKTNMPSMKTIYEKKFGKVETVMSADYQRSLDGNKPPISSKSNAVYEHLKQQFPLAPNPIMVMYIFPHLTGAGTPVPGYHTYFKLYESDAFYQPNQLRD